MGLGNHIDYRCADGRFLTSPCGMAVSNTRYLSGGETRVNTGKRGWELHLSEYILCQDRMLMLVVSVSQISEEQLLYSP